MKTTLSSPMPDARRQATRSMLVGHITATGAAPSAVAATRSAWGRPARIGLVAASAAAVAGVTAVAVIAGPGAEPAYASWTAVPQTSTGTSTPPADGDLQAWASQCTDLGVGGVSVEGLEDSGDADRRSVLVDRRGEVTYCVDVALGSGTEADPLVSLSGLRADGLSTMATTVTSEPYDLPSGGEVLVLGGDTTTPPAAPVEEGVTSLEVFQLYGLAGDDVTGIDIVLTNGLRITTTLTDGIWGAWWPSDKGDPTGVRLDLHTSDGQTATVDAAALMLQP
ncbi:hypothetical protein WDZ17_06460 [Pseudokineococcus basanitobsidens]|uniref:Uncharacterized protein n=1 Tax=Pseudokineococcus basanitobsidens TaxID=1926649 RepID=A0ABU8RIM6_9ACTN